MNLVQLNPPLPTDPKTAPPFPAAAKIDLRDTQLRRNVARATDTIQRKRAALVEEKTDWQALRDAGAAIRREALRNLDGYLLAIRRALPGSGRHGALGRECGGGESGRPRIFCVSTMRARSSRSSR